MPMPKINLNTPWLIPMATAVWAVWTWATDLARERKKARARISAPCYEPCGSCEPGGSFAMVLYNGSARSHQG